MCIIKKKKKPSRSGGNREDKMNCESRIDIYTLPCIKYVASGKLAYITVS